MAGVQNTCGNSEGVGGLFLLSKNGNSGVEGGSYMKFPPWWGYGYFLEPHKWVLPNFTLGIIPQLTGIPFGGSRNAPCCLMPQHLPKMHSKCQPDGLLGSHNVSQVTHQVSDFKQSFRRLTLRKFTEFRAETPPPPPCLWNSKLRYSPRLWNSS